MSRVVGLEKNPLVIHAPESKDGMEGWDDHKVAKFVEGVGSGKVWAQYAQKCVDDGIDGKSLCAADADDLHSLGFSKIHAKAVISARDSLFARVPTPMNAVTEAELAQLARFGPHRKLLDVSLFRIVSCLIVLPDIVTRHRREVNEIVDTAVAKWELARVEALNKLTVEEKQFEQELEQARALLRERQQAFEATAHSAESLCLTPVRLTDTQGLLQRRLQLEAMTQECLSVSFPRLTQRPSWRVLSDSEVLVAVSSSPCLLTTQPALPTLELSVQPSADSASVSWSQPAMTGRCLYVLQLCTSGGSRLAGEPPPYDEKVGEGDYEEIYRGNQLTFNITPLLQGTSYQLRARVEVGFDLGQWTVSSFTTPFEQLFDHPGLYTFEVPAGVTRLNAIVIGAGGSGGFLGRTRSEGATGTQSRFGSLIAEGGKGGEWQLGGAGGAGNVRAGGNGSLGGGGGAAGGESGTPGSAGGYGGSTLLMFAGHGGNGYHSDCARVLTSGPGAIEPPTPGRLGAMFGGGGGAGNIHAGGGGGGGYSQVENYVVTPGSSIEVDVGKGGIYGTLVGISGADGLVAITWGTSEV